MCIKALVEVIMNNFRNNDFVLTAFLILNSFQMEKRKFKAVICQLQADKGALVVPSLMKKSDRKQHLVSHRAQIIGLQRQRDFMDHEMTLLCTLNNSKDVLIQALQAKIEGTCSELSDLKSENDRNKVFTFNVFIFIFKIFV